MINVHTHRRRHSLGGVITLSLILVGWVSALAVGARAQDKSVPRTPLEAYARATEPLRDWAKLKEPTLEGNIKANREQERRAKAYLPRFTVADWKGVQLFNLGRLNFIALDAAGTEKAFSAYLQNPAAAQVTTARASLLWSLVAQKKWETSVPVAELLLSDPQYDTNADAYVQQLLKNSYAAGYDKTFALAQKWLSSFFRLVAAEQNNARATAMLNEPLEIGELYRESGNMTESDQFVAAFLAKFGQSRLAENARAKQNVETAMRRINLLGTPAPDIVGTDYIDMAQGDLAAFKGRVVLLDFFAHWCAPCVNELPLINALKSGYEAKGLEIVGVTQYYGFFGERKAISSVEELAALKDLKTDRRAKQGFVVGPRSNFDAYGVNGLPVLVFIDRAGRVRAVRTGGAGGPEIETMIQTLLAEPVQAGGGAAW